MVSVDDLNHSYARHSATHSNSIAICRMYCKMIVAYWGLHEVKVVSDLIPIFLRRVSFFRGCTNNGLLIAFLR
jgi:hypothetical protein